MDPSRTLWLFGAVTAALLAVMLGAHARSRRDVYGIFKTLASLTFVAAGAFLLPLHTGPGAALLAGLVLSLGGDVLLIPKGRRLTFLMGLSSFLLAHVAYAAAFLLWGAEPWAVAGGAVTMAVVGGPIARWLLPRVRGSMRGPVIAYVVTITAMVTLAAGAFGAGARPTVLLGAVLFYASDILVARERFVTPHKVNGLVGLPLYYAAQLLLIHGLSP